VSIEMRRASVQTRPARCKPVRPFARSHWPVHATTGTARGRSNPRPRELVPAAIPAPAAAPADPALAVPDDDDLFYTPIRGGADDNGHRYGTWASGPRYKVSFHDGMAFDPVLGSR
jgi:hypothetical protein